MGHDTQWAQLFALAPGHRDVCQLTDVLWWAGGEVGANSCLRGSVRIDFVDQCGLRTGSRRIIKIIKNVCERFEICVCL